MSEAAAVHSPPFRATRETWTGCVLFNLASWPSFLMMNGWYPTRAFMIGDFFLYYCIVGKIEQKWIEFWFFLSWIMKLLEWSLNCSIVNIQGMEGYVLPYTFYGWFGKRFTLPIKTEMVCLVFHYYLSRIWMVYLTFNPTYLGCSRLDNCFAHTYLGYDGLFIIWSSLSKDIDGLYYSFALTYLEYEWSARVWSTMASLPLPWMWSTFLHLHIKPSVTGN